MFDFIEAENFRLSLANDYAEMHRCATVGAWKCVQVLAGSVVEALLIDYLLATIRSRPGSKDPLRLDLAEAISVCRTEGLLNDRTADLSTVVRSYRNLIHPGRALRLAEEAPSESSAIIAMKLVDMITAQVESRRKETFGLTAEQLLSKLERDEGSVAILKHLLVDVNVTQRARFLLNVLPNRYLALKQHEGPDEEPYSSVSMTLDRLSRAYRIVLESADLSTKQRVAEWFVQIIRQEDGDTVRDLREAFFRSEDIMLVAEAHRPLVKEHLLDAAPYLHTTTSADMMSGLAESLQKSELQQWIDPFVRVIVSDKHDWYRRSVREAFLKGASAIPKVLEKAFDSRLDGWVKHLVGRGLEADAQRVRDLMADVEDTRLPF